MFSATGGGRLVRRGAELSGVFPSCARLREAAEKIAGYGRASVMLAREAVERAEEGGLREGLLFERRVFQSLFATDDQTEGMAAFSEKRSASFTGK